MTNTSNALAPYADVFKTVWAANAKALGTKPSADMFNAVHLLGARPGKQALFLAMTLRPVGCTAGQMQIACGAPQLNKMRGFITDALLKREAVPPVNGHTCYKLVVTPKGLKRIASSEAKAAALVAAGEADAGKPAKPAKKAAGKPAGAARKRAAKVTPPADGATGEPAAATNEPANPALPMTGEGTVQQVNA